MTDQLADDGCGCDEPTIPHRVAEREDGFLVAEYECSACGRRWSGWWTKNGVRIVTRLEPVKTWR